MTTTAPALSNPQSVADIDARISDERNRLLAEQNLQADLESQRIAPLESGDDVALDRVEKNLVSCLDRQSRIQERLGILAQRRDTAASSEEQAHDEAIMAQATALLEAGKKLITAEYPKAAKALIAILERMKSIDSQIGALHKQLKHVGGVGYPNVIRTIPGRTWEEQIGGQCVPVTSPQHSRHHEPHIKDVRKGCWINSQTGKQIPDQFIPHIVTRHEHAVTPPALPDEVVLPDFWPAP